MKEGLLSLYFEKCWPYVHSGSEGSFPWCGKPEDFVAGGNCSSVPEGALCTSLPWLAQGQIRASWQLLQMQKHKIHCNVKERDWSAGGSCELWALGPHHGEWLQVRMYLFSFMWLQAHSHSGSLSESTYSPRKLLSKGLWSLIAKEQDAPIESSSFWKLLDVGLGSHRGVSFQGGTLSTSAESW